MQRKSLDPYLDGKIARQIGAKKSDCPYGDFDSDATLWRAGWREQDQIERDEEQERKAA